MRCYRRGPLRKQRQYLDFEVVRRLLLLGEIAQFVLGQVWIARNFYCYEPLQPWVVRLPNAANRA